MGHETLLTVFAAGVISVCQRSCKSASRTWMSFTKAVLFTSPPCMGVSHQVTQAVLQFSVFCLNLRINIAKGKHISFYSASRGKARSRKGTEMKEVTTGGTHSPADEQTILRIVRKYFQHCGRAGQASLFPYTVCSYTVCHGHPKETSNPAAEGSKLSMVSSSPDCLHWAVPGRELKGSCGIRPAVCVLELSCLHRGLTHCSTLTCKGADFKAQLVVAMPLFSLPASRSPCVLGTAA